MRILKVAFLHLLSFLVFMVIWLAGCYAVEHIAKMTSISGTMLLGYLTGSIGLWISDRIKPN